MTDTDVGGVASRLTGLGAWLDTMARVAQEARRATDDLSLSLAPASSAFNTRGWPSLLDGSVGAGGTGGKSAALGAPQGVLDALKGSSKALEGYYKKATDYATVFEKFTADSFGRLETVVERFTKTGTFKFSDMIDAMIADLSRLAFKSAVRGPLASMLATGFNSIFNFLNPAPTTASGVKDGWMGNFTMPSLLNAKGGAYASGLGAWEGAVSDAPTLFDASAPLSGYARNGVFGEAGPEAVLPLARAANGSLGVMALGGGITVRPQVSVQVMNASGEKIAVGRNVDSQGNTRLDILVGEAVARQMITPGTSVNRAVSGVTGQRMPVNRR